MQEAKARECQTCGVEFTPTGVNNHLRKHCDKHFKGRNGIYVSTAGQARQKMICQLKSCKAHVPIGRATNGAKYCTHAHTVQAGAQRAADRKKAETLARARMLGVGEDTTERTGDAYLALIERRDLVLLLNQGEIAPAYVAHIIGFSNPAFSRSYLSVRTTMKFEELKKGWVAPWRVRAMLPSWKLQRLRELGPEGESTEEFELLVDELVHAYAVFSRYYFNLEGRRPINEKFHLVWIRSIIVCYAIGGKQNIQSPPRHGKSEMLVRFCVWLIVMFPNIRIMWVAANSDVAKLMLGAVKDHLANNEQLIADVLPPCDKFRPDKTSGRPWSAKEIKVAQQSHVGQKSSSMLALGRTTKILSRDVDLLIVDDLEDFDSTSEPAQREYSRNKFAEIGTRKEERTGWVNIGSRQHPDDIYSKLMAMGGSSLYGEDTLRDSLSLRTIVHSAHDHSCELDSDVIAGHDEIGCVLLPQVSSYRWLPEHKEDIAARRRPGVDDIECMNGAVHET